MHPFSVLLPHGKRKIVKPGLFFLMAQQGMQGFTEIFNRG